jgi:soluble lytic murein transglycosylase-like protein
MTAILVASMGIYLAPINLEARAAGVPADVLAAVCYHETLGEPDRASAIGLHGEMGLCQVLPQTALRMGASPLPGALLKPRENIRAAARWLRYCMSLGAEAVRQLAHCYNEGRFTDTSKTAYASRIADMVMAMRMERGLALEVALR